MLRNFAKICVLIQFIDWKLRNSKGHRLYHEQLDDDKLLLFLWYQIFFIFITSIN